jgi:CheY-like chemotaxis protein
MAEVADLTDPTELTDPTDPTDPTNRAEQADPTDSTELDVLVAHESAEMRAEIRDALDGRMRRIIEADNGDEALGILLRDHPRLLVVDVALRGRASFQICDDIRQAGLRTKVVLVASVYNHTRYKRRPTSLYGAHDYVEQHHIHDMLPAKVDRLLGRGWAEPTAGDVDPGAAQRIREAGDAMLTIRYDSLKQGRDRAQRLCELIVADLALYNGDLLSALNTGAEAPPRLQADLDAARRLFEQRVPAEIRGHKDWILDAFERLLRSRAHGEAATGGSSRPEGEGTSP